MYVTLESISGNSNHQTDNAMKIKLVLSALFTFIFYLLSSQVPHGFNYQAIARNNNEIISNQSLPVTITIQSAPEGGTIYWVEEHPSIMTNGNGLFSLVVGTGNYLSGEAEKFSDINWNITPKYIKTQVLYEGELKDMGTSALWSVPYSMVAGGLNDTLDKLVVKGGTADMGEALFEVKNKDGKTVFAVYNEGVRVYIDDGIAGKGPKGDLQ